MGRAFQSARGVLLKLFLVLATVSVMTPAVPAAVGWFDWEKAVSLYKQGQYREAVAEFERVLVEYPDHADSWKFIGLSWYFLKEHAKAVPALEKSLELKRKEGRNDIELIRAIGQADLALGRFDQALPHLETLARLQMNVATNFYLLGVAYANLNRREESLQSFQRALQLDPTDVDSRYFIASQQFRGGKLTEAIATLREGITTAPKSPELLNLLAEVCLRQGAAVTDEKLAVPWFEEALRAAQTLRTVREDAASTELLGRALLAARKSLPAEQMLTRALEMSPQPSAVLHFNLGLARAQNKSWNRAAESLSEADRLAPNDLNTLYYLGYAYENLRLYQQAYDAYSKALELGERGNADIRARLDRIAPLIKK